ncbi:mobile mystery protein A [Pontibacter sp. HSC-14F20]|uniref:mobile mystery protein A n=1 Tax=Pontibacter sp. HSC-14F20 TaxID=2864136 RepID=UPI001C733DC2|nr:mobile mystery protein A [Pontibacter sp. HSC-14F20]MBX0335345.1 mobile mystery protein A [Pontibacter sp. HSC-14F20]
MRNKKKLLLEQLDRKIAPLKVLTKTPVPEQGWIHAIRVALNMTLEQLGHKLGKTKQGIKKIEEREATGTVSLNVLKQVAEALDMQLVYGFVPKQGSMEKLVDQRAQQLARKIVLRTSQHMKLENQGNSDDRIRQAIEELAEELKREMKGTLWD